MRKVLVLSSFVVMLSILFAETAKAQSGTVTDDAFVSSNAATELLNLKGQATSLIVAGSSATVGSVSVGTAKSYIKFQLQSSLPPNLAAANIQKATLKLFLSPLTAPTGAIDIYPVTSAWSESTLSGSSTPTLAANPVASGVSLGSANSFLVVDVTQLVQEWLEGPNNGGLVNDGIALVAHTSSSYVVFDSKESIVTSHEPRLEIVLTNTGTQGPTGPAGPAGPAGVAGAAGPAGAAGQTATITVGTTLTGQPGSLASVLNGGTPNAAVLNFVIPQGPIGSTGSQGPQGPAGVQGPVGIDNRGQWSAANAYNPNDAVADQGSFWLALQAIPANTANSEPSATNPSWQLLAAQGAQGQSGTPGQPGPQGQAGPQGIPGPTGPTGPAGPQGPQGPAGTSSAGGSSSLLSAFLPGPLTQTYTAASFVPDTPITVTHISAAFKTPPDSSCSPTVLRVTDGNTGQDVRALGGQATKDTGPLVLPFSSGTPLQVQVHTAANCAPSFPYPADANLVVEYRGQLGGDQTTCAQSGLVCNGICEETQTDPNNCGACGNVCPTTPFFGQLACVSGTCGSCGAGLTTCNNTCTNLQTDPSNCGACGTACLSGQVCTAGQCIGSSPNGAACSAPNQCNGGFCTNGVCSSCSFVHSNGTGLSYTDCANPLGTPGNPATYNLTMAQEAANAYGGSTTAVTCASGAAAILSSKTTGFAVWVYQGFLAGYVLVSTDPLAPLSCPSQSSPTWN